MKNRGMDMLFANLQFGHMFVFEIWFYEQNIQGAFDWKLKSRFYGNPNQT